MLLTITKLGEIDEAALRVRLKAAVSVSQQSLQLHGGGLRESGLARGNSRPVLVAAVNRPPPKKCALQAGLGHKASFHGCVDRVEEGDAIRFIRLVACLAKLRRKQGILSTNRLTSTADAV